MYVELDLTHSWDYFTASIYHFISYIVIHWWVTVKALKALELLRTITMADVTGKYIFLLFIWLDSNFTYITVVNQVKLIQLKFQEAQSLIFTVQADGNLMADGI